MKSFLAVLFALALSGCSTITGLTDGIGNEAEIPTKYAVAKVIGSSDSITGEGVLDVTAKVRTYVESDGELLLDELMAQAEDAINFDKLDPADAMLVRALLEQIQYAIADDMPELAEDRKVRILTLLDWIDETAALYANLDS